MSNNLSVGIVDSGHPAEHSLLILAARRFWLDNQQVRSGDAEPDRLGHGSAVLEKIAEIAVSARFCVAQVFHERWYTSPLQIAEALHWLIGQQVRVINLSLGVRVDRPVLREACAQAVAAGIVLCAASPAQGAPVFPASYPGVLRVTGDARCATHQWSWLNSVQADFGAVVTSSRSTLAGASIASAAICGAIAAYFLLHPEASREELLEYLQSRAAFVGIERRRYGS